MHFDQILAGLRSHLRYRRAGWPAGAWIEMQRPDAHSKMSRPYLFHADSLGNRCPWLPGQDDLFASDWSVIA